MLELNQHSSMSMGDSLFCSWPAFILEYKKKKFLVYFLKILLGVGKCACFFFRKIEMFSKGTIFWVVSQIGLRSKIYKDFRVYFFMKNIKKNVTHKFLFFI